MTDPVVVLTALGIYFAGFLTVLGLARHETWQYRKAKDAFYRDHVDKVTTLERAQEVDLIATIYKSQRLRALFASPDRGVEPRFTQEERMAVETEIDEIKKGFKAVNDSRGIFEKVCSSYDGIDETLDALTLYGLLASSIIPIDFALVASNWPSGSGVALVVSAAGGYGALLLLSKHLATLRKASKSLDEGKGALKKMVEEKIYGLPSAAEATPPRET